VILEDAMADSSNDPVAMWHSMLGEMEKGFNAFAKQAMTPRFGTPSAGASSGAQNQVGDMMEKYLTSMNLPSRAQLADFGERLETIEARLSEITALLRQFNSHAGAAAAAPVADPVAAPVTGSASSSSAASAVPAKPPRKRPPPGEKPK
jgi:hypothetical protein